MEVCALQSVDKKEIVEIRYQEVFTKGDTDVLKKLHQRIWLLILKEMTRDMLVSNILKIGYPGIAPLLLSANGAFMTRLNKGIKSLHAIADIAFIRVDYWIFLLKINELKKQESLYFESRMVKLPNNGVK